MPDYTITLTAAEDLALQHWMDVANAARASERDDQDQPLPPLTVQQALHLMVHNDLENRLCVPCLLQWIGDQPWIWTTCPPGKV